MENFLHFVPIFLKCRISNGICIVYPISERFEPSVFPLPYLLPTNNSDVWIVALDWKKKGSFDWSNSSTVYLWKVNKNNPTVPISTSAGDVQTPPSSGGDVSGSYDDDNYNGWDDGADEYFNDYWNEFPPPERDDYVGEVIMPDTVYIDSDYQNDYDGWFDYDQDVRQYLEDLYYDAYYNS